MDNFREQINKIDEKIMQLLINRFLIVKEIGQYKKQHNLPILDNTREQKIYSKIEDFYLLEDNRDYLKKIYTEIMSQSKNIQIKL
jgi:chorismate mutase